MMIFVQMDQADARRLIRWLSWIVVIAIAVACFSIGGAIRLVWMLRFA